MNRLIATPSMTDTWVVRKRDSPQLPAGMVHLQQVDSIMLEHVPLHIHKTYIVEIVYANGVTEKRRVTNDGPVFIDGPVTEVTFRELVARRQTA
jgi:hypothetical protein